MQIQERINAFTTLGSFLGQFSTEIPKKKNQVPHNDVFYERMLTALQNARFSNGWFTEDNLRFTCQSWSKALTEENLKNWLSDYTLPENMSAKTVAIIMAGNIPLVGFHDFLSVLIAGHKVAAKVSSNDKVLFPVLAEYLTTLDPRFIEQITITNEKLPKFDAVIATGSNNTARYFEHYFGKYPHIIRKNRNSVAVLDGSESPEQLANLADDVFRYFGLGCRNVSKLYVPENYNWEAFFKGMYTWKEVINNHKYINNYDYNKAVYLMDNCNLLDNEFMLLKEDTGFSSPISVVFYEHYANQSDLDEKLAENEEHIQCVVSQEKIPFGKAQHPGLADYADGVDTLTFLLSL